MNTHMRKFHCRLAAAAPVVLSFAALAPARAQSPCGAETTAPPAVTETITCSEAGISRFFLISPAMAQLGADQRAAVVSHPLRYAFAYMTADAANRLQAGFAAKSVQSIDYKAIIETTGPKGATALHDMFGVKMDRATAARMNWRDMPPGDLFKDAPSHISPWLTKSLAAEDKASLPQGPAPAAPGAGQGKTP